MVALLVSMQVLTETVLGTILMETATMVSTATATSMAEAAAATVLRRRQRRFHIPDVSQRAGSADVSQRAGSEQRRQRRLQRRQRRQLRERQQRELRDSSTIRSAADRAPALCGGGRLNSGQTPGPILRGSDGTHGSLGRIGQAVRFSQVRFSPGSASLGCHSA